MSVNTEKTETMDGRRKFFRDFRKGARLTLVECSRLSDISDAMLSQFENGNRNLSEGAWTRLRSAMEKFLLTDSDALHATFGTETVMEILRAAGESKGREGNVVGEESGRILADRLLAINDGVAQEFGYGKPPSNLAMTVVWCGSLERALFDYNPKLGEQHAAAQAEKYFPLLMKEHERRSRIAELERSIEAEKRRLAALEKILKDQSRIEIRKIKGKRKPQATPLDDPIVSELMDSLRREIAEKDKQLETLNRTLEKK